MKKIKNYALFILMNIICLMTNAETYVVTADKLNVRSEASKTGGIIGTLQHGDAVNIENIDGEWATVNINGKTGYVSTQYLVPSESSQKSVKSKKKSSISETIFILFLLFIFVGIPIMVGIRKFRRKVRNFKADVKDGGLGEAMMSRFEDYWDNAGKKHNH